MEKIVKFKDYMKHFCILVAWKYTPETVDSTVHNQNYNCLICGIVCQILITLLHIHAI